MSSKQSRSNNNPLLLPPFFEGGLGGICFSSQKNLVGKRKARPLASLSPPPPTPLQKGGKATKKPHHFAAAGLFINQAKRAKHNLLYAAFLTSNHVS